MPTTTDTAPPAETEAVAAELARRLRPGDIVLVSGDPGARCQTLAARCSASAAPDRHPLYRLGALDDEDPSLLADELGTDRVASVQWPEVGSPVGLDPERVAARVRLEHRGGDRRRVFVET